MELTGKDLKAYRTMLGLSQRAFANGHDTKRGTVAQYEWKEKVLPQWFVDKIMRFDPNFCFWCLQNREVNNYLKQHNETKKEQKLSWFGRFIAWIMGY